jgi:hypothetical protein
MADFFTTIVPAISPVVIAWNISYIIIGASLVLLTMHIFEAYTSRSQKTTSIISTSRLARLIQSKVFGIRSQATESQGPLLRSLPVRNQRTLNKKENIDSPRAEMYATVSLHMHTIASSHLRSVYLGRSTFESPSIPSLYAKHKHFTNTTYLGPVCTLDPTSGSLSMCLHPEDIANVLSGGWGRKVRGADEVLIHAPRNEAEMQIVRECMDAALGWVCKGEVEEGEDIAEADRPVWLLPHISL